MADKAEQAAGLTHVVRRWWSSLLGAPRRITLLTIILLVLASSVFAYTYYRQIQNEEAQSELFQAVYYFEADSLRLALEGDGVNYGFLELIERYDATEVSNLAHFYAGICYLKMGKYEESIEQIEDFEASDWLLAARAQALIGDAHMELGRSLEAAEFYQKAANHRPNEVFSPVYLRKAAIAYEKSEDHRGAVACYRRILEDYPDADREEATKQVQRLEESLTTK